MAWHEYSRRACTRTSASLPIKWPTCEPTTCRFTPQALDSHLGPSTHTRKPSIHTSGPRFTPLALERFLTCTLAVNWHRKPVKRQSKS
eukprot:1179057-Pyramimonas_sp.AAC.1